MTSEPCSAGDVRRPGTEHTRMCLDGLKRLSLLE